VIVSRIVSSHASRARLHVNARTRPLRQTLRQPRTVTPTRRRPRRTPAPGSEHQRPRHGGDERPGTRRYPQGRRRGRAALPHLAGGCQSGSKTRRRLRYSRRFCGLHTHPNRRKALDAMKGTLQHRTGSESGGRDSLTSRVRRSVRRERDITDFECANLVRSLQ
jgi:hypothetical protein